MKIYELFQNPKAYCKGRYAVNQAGLSVKNDYGIAWCLSGAVYLLYPSHEAYTIFQRLREALGSLRPQYGDKLIVFNDDPATTVEMVRELAIKADV